MSFVSDAELVVDAASWTSVKITSHWIRISSVKRLWSCLMTSVGVSEDYQPSFSTESLIDRQISASLRKMQ